MQVRRSTTLVLVRGFVDGVAVTPPLNATLEIAGDEVAMLPEQTNCRESPRVHQQTVSEAKEVWRYEGNPN